MGETTRRLKYGVSGRERLVLTIACHPLLRRIGERAVLGRETLLSRSAPDFCTSQGRVVGPLDDPSFADSPLVLVLHGEEAHLRVSASAGVRIDGRTVTGPTRVPTAALRRGVTLAIGEQILLLLQLEAEAAETLPRYGLVGESAALQRVREGIALTAVLPMPVLIRGESGTGKVLVARAIHAVSPRASRPYVSLNMAALNPQTAVAELFGHTRGSFTGAAQARDGYFREADGGTIFLDEIGEAPLEIQAMLLRVLETGEIQPVGGVGSRRVDVRVFAATDADLEGAVQRGSFRLALLHRLAGFELTIPPLRQRRDDIPALVVHFLAQELHRAGYSATFDALAADAAGHLGPDLMAHLLDEPWPGNARQLANAVRQMAAALIVGRPITSLPMFAGRAAPAAPPSPSPSPSARAVVADEVVVAALHAHGWNIHATARHLGMSRNTLYARMKRCEGVSKAADIPADELAAAQARHRGDLAGMAAALRVSLRALQLRLRAGQRT